MNRLATALLAGICGCILLFVLFPRVHPAAGWHYQYDRSGAIERAREVAREQRVDTAGWSDFVTSDHNGRLEFYKMHHPGDVAARKLSTATTTVTFVRPDRRRVFAAQLHSDGTVAGWEQKIELTDRSGPYTEMFDAKGAAIPAFRAIAGETAALYKLSTDAAGTQQGSRFTWELLEPAAGFQPTIDVIANKGEVVHAETHYTFSQEQERDYVTGQRGSDWLAIPFFVLYFVMVIGASVLYTLGAIQRKVDHRFALLFALVSMLFLLASSFSGPMPDVIRSMAAMQSSKSVVGYSGLTLSLIGNALLAWVIAGAGLFIAGPLVGKWRSVRRLFTRQIFSKPVGLSLAAGTLWALPLAAAVPVAAALFPGVLWDRLTTAEFFGHSLVLQMLSHPLHPTWTGLFGVLLAFVLVRIRQAWLRRPLFALTGLIFFCGFESYFKNSAPANLLAGALSFAIAYTVFYRFDLLAVGMAMTMKVVYVYAAMLFLQPSQGLHALGWHLVAFAGATLAAGLVLYRKAPDPAASEEAAAQSIASGIKSAREQLKSEFSIAQRAQREMLPARPPAIPGFTLAAHCTPAKDVGGDLYDFLPLSGNRLAIAVGDVSGKGVPAALYMTLTKGLLAATTQENLDLPAILQHVNTHLHAVCRRKTFVTMAIGVLDPAARSFDYARAGHNPAVWRSASSGASRLLKGSGIGLGITGGAVFGRTLSVERLNLSSGDTLVFYSDGLTEAMNPKLEQFGEERLMEVVDRVNGSSAAELRDDILAEVTQFLDGNHPQDDLTIVVLRVE